MDDFNNAGWLDKEPGDPVFNIDGTCRVGNVIHVLSAEADDALFNKLAAFHYAFEKMGVQTGQTSDLPMPAYRDELPADHPLNEGYVAFLPFSQGGNPLCEPVFFVTLGYKDQAPRRHTLFEKDIHTTILAYAGVSPYLDDHRAQSAKISPDHIKIMSLFVERFVDVDRTAWDAFVAESQALHAQDFIRRLAWWAGQTAGDPADRRVPCTKGEPHNALFMNPDMRFCPIRKASYPEVRR